MASENPNKQENKVSTTDLFSSAQVLAGAAQATLRKENIDKSKVAGAADDLLDAASEYGKLKETGYGEYVEKAETFIKQYESSGEKPKEETQSEKPEESKETTSEKPEESGGGIGSYVKLAQGFLK